MNWATFVLALVQPMVARVIVALGFSVVSITGLTMITGGLKTQAVDGIGTLSPAMLNLFLLAGGSQGLGIILGALATKLMLVTLQGQMKFLGVNPA